MKILNSIKFENEANKNNFTKELKNIEQKELITLNYSLALEESFKNLFNKMEKADTNHFIKYTADYIILLNRLSITHFCNIIHWLDTTYPGLSLHFVLEAKHNRKKIVEKDNLLKEDSSNKQQVSEDENLIFYQRLYQLENNNLLNNIFAPMRKKLVSLMLETEEVEEEDSVYGIEFKEGLVNNEFFQWLKGQAKPEEIENLEKYKNKYVMEKANNKNNKAYTSESITYIPTLLEESKVLEIITKLIGYIDNEHT